MSKKLNIDYIRNVFADEGYILLTSNYINNKQKLDYVCKNDHKHNISWGAWSRGQRCAYCSMNGKPPLDKIKYSFEKEGYKLLTFKYINARINNLKYICNNGHKHNTSWDNWKRGYRCPYCNGRPVMTIEFVKSEMKKEGYELLDKEYFNCKTNMKYICSDGHNHKTNWSMWNTGHRCPMCAIISLSGDKHPNWKGGISCEPYCDIWADKEYKRSILERDGYRCQNPYCYGTSKKLTVHHIDYNKKHCDPWNLITLCNSCNSRANFNRDYHKDSYSKIIYKKK